MSSYCLVILVELSIHRGTISAIRRQELPEGDTDSVISEDLREYDEEYGVKKAEIPGRLCDSIMKTYPCNM